MPDHGDELASRLVLAADSDRRRIERELHDGPQQELVALSVNLQLARRLLDSDPAAARALIDEMRQDVQKAIDATRSLAHQIYPPLLDAGGLAAALRAAAPSADIRVTLDAPYPPEVVAATYFCIVDALEGIGPDEKAAVAVGEAAGALEFEIVTAAETDVTRARDRAAALGGTLTVADGRIVGSLPL
jgi:signal transduction histidine kinase